MTNSRRTSRGPVPGRGPAVEKHWPTWSRILPEKLSRRQLLKKRTTDSGGSLPHSQTPTLHQNNKVHASPLYFLKIHFNIILHLHQGLSSGLFPSGLPHQNAVFIPLVFHTCHMPDASHSSRFDYPNIWCRVEIMKLLVGQSVFFSTAFLKLKFSWLTGS